jgi:ABC-type nitrate/sulfonate/bicarbonate transport system substrate-binding protein
MTVSTLGILSAFLLGFFSMASQASSQLTKLNVITTGVSPTSLPSYIAKESGIFAKNGLDAQVVRATSSIAVMALISGELGVIEVAGPSIVRSNLRGADVVFVAAGVVTLNYWLMSAKHIKSPEQLKGGVIGSSDLSGSSFIAIQFALRKLGLNAERDATIIRAGGTPERLVGLQTGRLQATVLNPPTSFLAQKEGFNLLTDVTGMPFQHNAVATTRRFIREHPNVVRRYVKSQIEAVHLMKTDRQAGIAILMKALKAKPEERALVEKSYNSAMGEEVYPHKQYPSLRGLQTILDAMVKEEPKAKDAKPEDFVDSSFVKELDDSGFISNLYKEKKN